MRDRWLADAVTSAAALPVVSEYPLPEPDVLRIRLPKTASARPSIARDAAPSRARLCR